MREQKGACLPAHLLQVDRAVGMSRGRETPYRGRREREQLVVLLVSWHQDPPTWLL